jgi:uncharacterized glyoxalase superfamily protein PhnB
MPRKKADQGPNLFPAIRYNDAPQALRWLRDAFGFSERMSMPNPDGTIAHAELSLGSGSIMVGSVKEESSNPWDAERHGIYVYVEDVDAHFRKAKAAGATIVRDLKDTAYASREYSCRDLEGNLWSFGTYRPGAHWKKEETPA